MFLKFLADAGKKSGKRKQKLPASIFFIVSKWPLFFISISGDDRKTAAYIVCGYNSKKTFLKKKFFLRPAKNSGENGRATGGEGARAAAAARRRGKGAKRRTKNTKRSEKTWRLPVVCAKPGALFAKRGQPPGGVHARQNKMCGVCGPRPPLPRRGGCRRPRAATTICQKGGKT